MILTTAPFEMWKSILKQFYKEKVNICKELFENKLYKRKGGFILVSKIGWSPTCQILNISNLSQACSQVWIWEGAFPANVDLFACFLGDSGIFCMYFRGKVGLLRAFFKIVDFFACSSHVRGMFPGKILKNMTENYASRDIMIQLYSIPNCD